MEMMNPPVLYRLDMLNRSNNSLSDCHMAQHRQQQLVEAVQPAVGRQLRVMLIKVMTVRRLVMMTDMTMTRSPGGSATAAWGRAAGGSLGSGHHDGPLGLDSGTSDSESDQQSDVDEVQFQAAGAAVSGRCNNRAGWIFCVVGGLAAGQCGSAGSHPGDSCSCCAADATHPSRCC